MDSVCMSVSFPFPFFGMGFINTNLSFSFYIFENISGFQNNWETSTNNSYTSSVQIP